MRTRVPHLIFASLSLACTLAACTGDAGTEDAGTVVLGIRSNLTPGGGLDSMRVVIEAGGEVVVDEERSAASGDLEFPAELAVEGLDDGELVEATVSGVTGGTPSIERLASTRAVAGKSLLLEVELEAACLQAPGSPAPTCDAPTTCIHSVCQKSYVPPEKLPEYDPGWSDKTVGPCKPAGAGDPVVVVGEGQADYLPMEDGAVAQVEAGPQGGHHIWVAVRLKNLTQSGSITSLTGRFPELGYDVGPFNVIFTFDPDEGGYCKIYGLRFQIDTHHDIQELLGHTFEVTATITDKDKDVGVGKKTVVLSKDILGG